jgi:hypothetical protein
VTNESVARTNPRRWALAACAALIVAAVGDAGPEIIESGSLVAGYDGPGPLIYLGVAAVVAAVRWRFMPLLAAMTGVFFLFGGFSDASFVSRLRMPTDPVPFWAGWIQTAGFAAAVAFGIVATRRHRAEPARTEIGGPTMSVIATRTATAPRSTRWSLRGLAVGIAGLVVQWIAEPGKFFPFPPGIVFIAVFGALTVITARRWWAPVFAVLISLWIVLGGLAAGQLTPNLVSPHPGTVAGTAVMSIGLAFAAVTGIMAIIHAWQARSR